MSESDDFDYDIAFSFAGEDRAIVEELATRLTDEGVRVFYDAYEKAALWGKDLYQHLQIVYSDRARYCVVIVSAAYSQKLWTRHELKQAQTRHAHHSVAKLGNFPQDSGILRHNSEQRTRGARGSSPTLFPILQRPHRDPKQLRELRL